MTSFKVNGQTVTFDGDSKIPLLWVLRDHLKLTGTKFSCGVGLCGACVVHLDGRTAASCRVPASTLEGRSVTTIEGLAPGSFVLGLPVFDIARAELADGTDPAYGFGVEFGLANLTSR